MYHVPLAVQCIYGCNDEGEDEDGKEERREWILDYMILSSESKEDMRVMVGWFVEVGRRKRLTVNADNS